MFLFKHRAKDASASMSDNPEITYEFAMEEQAKKSSDTGEIPQIKDLLAVSLKNMAKAQAPSEETKSGALTPNPNPATADPHMDTHWKEFQQNREQKKMAELTPSVQEATYIATALNKQV